MRPYLPASHNVTKYLVMASFLIFPFPFIEGRNVRETDREKTETTFWGFRYLSLFQTSPGFFSPFTRTKKVCRAYIR